MKKRILTLLLALGFCQVAQAHQDENLFVRLLVADSQHNQLHIITPAQQDKTILTLPNGGEKYLYASGSQRFGFVVQPDANQVHFVDSAVESHGDHAHPDGAIRFAKTVSHAIKPLHVNSLGGRFVIFNDGDLTTGRSSYSLGREAALYSNHPLIEKTAGINQHGAAVLFDNRTLAITEKSDLDSASLPDILTIRDPENQLLYKSQSLTGIHGQAGNGHYALFGSQQGIIIADEQGNIELIKHPTGFNATKGNWFGKLFYGAAHDTFLAQADNHGIYRINLTQKTVHQLLQSANIITASFDSSGHNLISIEKQSGSLILKIIDILSGQIINQTKLSLSNHSAIALAASKKFIYVTDPNAQQVLQLDRATLTNTQRFDVAPLNPNKILFIGADLMEGEH